MLFTTSSRKLLAEHHDVHSTLHVPMTYESVPVSLPAWEYRVVHIDMREEELLNEEALNELGTQGWLLVSILEQPISERSKRVHYHFVRQKVTSEP